VDTIGNSRSGTTFSKGDIYGNGFEIFSSRVLTQIEVKLQLPSARDIIWQVYELDGATWQGILRCETTSSSLPVDSVFVSSGPMSCSLESGKRYMIAVQDTASDLADIATHVSNFNDDPFPTSFAQWIGSTLRPSSNAEPLALDPNQIRPFVMQLTTASP
jgi:hypothetical protein